MRNRLRAVARPRPIHLLDVGVRWPPETFIARRLRGLAERGVRVTVVTASRAPERDGPIEIVRVPDWRELLLSSASRVAADGLAVAASAPGRLATILRALPRRDLRLAFAKLRAYLPVARLRPDVVHFEWNSAAIEYLPLFDTFGCPIVVSCRGEQVEVRPRLPDGDAYARQLVESLRRATAVHCVSEAMRARVVELGVARDSTVVIRPAVDPAVFRPGPARPPRAEFRIVMVGSLIWRKGYEYALLALRRLVETVPAARLEIVGEGADRQRILYGIHDLGLRGRVALWGRLGPDEILALLQDADAFLLASHSEGISNAVLEAMACELPAVSTECGGMREVITDGVDGYLVAPRDHEAMARALAILATDRERALAMGRAARRRILEGFTLSRQVDAWLELYARLCE